MYLLNDPNLFLDNTGYPPAWKIFRYIYREDVCLLELVKTEIGSLAPLPQGFSVYDIGCGDGDLARKILSDNMIFKIENRPQRWYLVEPMQEFSSDIEKISGR